MKKQKSEIHDLAKSLSINAKAFGHDIKLNIAQQIIASMGGYDAWQALIVNKATKAPAKTSDIPAAKGFIRVFVNTCTTSEGGDYPKFASFDVAPDFIAAVRRMQQLVKDNNLSSVRECWNINWFNNNEFRMQNEEIIVFDDSFVFSAHPKHADYEVETRFVSIDQLEKMIADAVKNGEFCLIYDDNGCDHDSLDESVYERINCFKVEYDVNFFGGDYSGVGEFAYIPLDDELELSHSELFCLMTGVDPVHVIHIPLDETYTIDGELKELLD